MKVSRLSVILIFAVGLLFACQNPTNAGSEKPKSEAPDVSAAADAVNIDKGKALFESKCIFCHDAESTDTIVGPGLKGILQGGKLPVSGRPATEENIADQIRTPFKSMPSFAYLADEDVKVLISYLNTL